MWKSHKILRRIIRCRERLSERRVDTRPCVGYNEKEKFGDMFADMFGDMFSGQEGNTVVDALAKQEIGFQGRDGKCIHCGYKVNLKLNGSLLRLKCSNRHCCAEGLVKVADPQPAQAPRRRIKVTDMPQPVDEA